MPPRVTYWTGRWEPAREAISKEVEALRTGERIGAPIVSFCPGQAGAVDLRRRVIRLPARRWLALRALAAVIERVGHVSHVFGGFSSWHLLRALGRRPIVLTAVTGAGQGPVLLPRLPVVVAVESESLVDEWRRAGMPTERIRVIHPGVDLHAHSTLPPNPAARLQLLFASSPSTAAELAGRGVPLLVELARRRPDVDILIPWRQWGDIGNVRQALAALRPPPNLIVRHEDAADMGRYYAQAHAVVVPFGLEGGKACPNSVLEGLACGRPALVSEACGIAPLLRRAGAAVVSEPTLAGLSSGIDVLQRELPVLTRRARQVAEEHFDIEHFRRRYEQLYEEVARELLPLPNRAHGSTGIAGTVAATARQPAAARPPMSDA